MSRQWRTGHSRKDDRMTLPDYVERYTLEDWRQWEGDWELIDGVAYAMAPSPTVSHQTIASALYAQLYAQLENSTHCRALYETDVEFSRQTVVRPDILIICYEPEGDRLTRAPDLIIEVVSPQTARRDEVLKFALYREEGVAFYLIAYPEERRVKAWRLIDGEYRKLGDFQRETQRFQLSKCAVELDFAKVWRDKPGSA